MFVDAKGAETKMRMSHKRKNLFNLGKENDDQNKIFPAYDMRDDNNRFKLRKRLDDGIDRM